MAQQWMMDWSRAHRIDETLEVGPKAARRIDALQLRPIRYSRARLFRAMARQEVILFSDHPVAAPLRLFFLRAEAPLEHRLAGLFPASATTLTKLGAGQKRAYMKVHQVVDLWSYSNRILSANDVFYRDLRLDRVFDCSAFSDFNILCGAPAGIRDLEVATMLMGTVGAMSDSHSDDPDGTNHCIMGRKLWLVWDREEGRANGIQDCEYDFVRHRARFDPDAFVSMRTARWFTVSAGQTLFMPGNLTHKVITIERYLGLSSFYVTLPNALASIGRWLLRPTNMINAAHREAITRLVKQRLRRTREADRATKHRWGYYFMKEAADALFHSCTTSQRRRLRNDPTFVGLATEMAESTGGSGWTS